ncbi:MAG: hypothetical protein EKK52_18580 [Burkholderiales bacterium]|uniref:hypothetical protein n=1 Tax=Roseateles sp. TaxID=1971397 RepID=UPI000FBDEFC9|nr:MAG: hypothetical protein EKK52_18580 [Burkholderiales bacterium]
MTKQCAARGCTEGTTGYSTLCDNHKHIQRRHGHPEQGGITVHRLRPYLKRVEARRAKNKDSDAWSILEARWSALEAHAQGILAEWASGKAMVSAQVQAAQQLQALSGSVPPSTIVNTALAMFLMRDAEPRRFASDRAFDFQLVRRVRGLAPVNAGSYWNHKAQRTTKVYRDLPPRVAELLGRQLREAFGLAGFMLAEKERAEEAKAQDQQRRLAEALEALA